MTDETFAAALRAELDALVGRYETLVRTVAALGGRETDALRAEAARLAAENQRLRSELDARRADAERQSARVVDLERELEQSRARGDELERAAKEAALRSQDYEEQFSAERGFVEAAGEASGSLLGDALVAAIGRPLDATSASYAALKARGLEATLVAALRDRGRGALAAPLLPRERAALATLARAAGCELVEPAHGTRFAAASMEKAGTVSEPSEEGNVVSTAAPGLRRAGTEGALVFPRVVVASG
jgi:hypothetical protein